MFAVHNTYIHINTSYFHEIIAFVMLRENKRKYEQNFVFPFSQSIRAIHAIQQIHLLLLLFLPNKKQKTPKHESRKLH